MVELIGKTITLRDMNQKEMRALWRKYEPIDNPKYSYNEEAVDALFNKLEEKSDAIKMLGIFSISDEVIGALTLLRIVFSEKRCELDLFLATEAHRNKGFGTEAINLIKKYAQKELGLTRIYADVSEKNLRMQALLKKCGFLNCKAFKGGMPDGSNRLSYVCVL